MKHTPIVDKKSLVKRLGSSNEIYVEATEYIEKCSMELLNRARYLSENGNLNASFETAFRFCEILLWSRAVSEQLLNQNFKLWANAYKRLVLPNDLKNGLTFASKYKNEHPTVQEFFNDISQYMKPVIEVPDVDIWAFDNLAMMGDITNHYKHQEMPDPANLSYIDAELRVCPEIGRDKITKEPVSQNAGIRSISASVRLLIHALYLQREAITRVLVNDSSSK